MVEVGTGTHGTRFLNKDWPITEGTTAGTTKLRKKWQLSPSQGTLVAKRNRVGL